MTEHAHYRSVESFWIEATPKHWKTLRNKNIFVETKVPVGDNWRSYTLLTMGKGGVKPRDIEAGGKFPESFDTYQVVSPDQLVFCLFDLDETPRTVGLSKDHGMITSAYDVFSVNHEHDPQYWTYFYQAIDDVKGLRPFYTGLRKVVRSDTFRSIQVFAPPLHEQQLISRYLDEKTQQIDTLIEKIEKKIELLKEQRTSLINHYVTKGLNPNVEMKDSGVEWIEKIPKHWTVSRLKYLSTTSVQYGLNIESDAYTDSGVRFLRITDIGTDGSIKATDGVYLKPTDVPTDYILQKGDFLISRSGASVGKSTLIESDFETTSYAGYLVRFSFSDPVVARFIKWVSESRMYWDWVSLQTTQSTIQNVNGEKYANFSLPLPPTEELTEIDRLLSQRSKKITKMISFDRERQRLLKEYRQSLISSVVTGKFRVTEDME